VGAPINYEKSVKVISSGEKFTQTSAAALLSDLYPKEEGAKERTAKNWPFRKSTKMAKDGIKWTKDGQDKEYIWKEGGSEKLLNDIAKEFGYEIPFPKAEENREGRTLPPPAEDSVIELTPIQKQATEASESFEDIVQQQVEAHGITKEEAESGLVANGVTPDLWEIKPTPKTKVKDVKITQTKNIETPKTVPTKDIPPVAVKATKKKEPIKPIERISQGELDKKLKIRSTMPVGARDDEGYSSIKTSVKVVDSPELDSETLRGFREVIGNPKYSQKRRYDIG
ncbi:unnamed protein product, partial [marine sediment metagenome]